MEKPEKQKGKTKRTMDIRLAYLVNFIILTVFIGNYLTGVWAGFIAYEFFLVMILPVLWLTHIVFLLVGLIANITKWSREGLFERFIFVLLILLIIQPWRIYLRMYLMNLGLRTRVACSIGTDELEAWATGFMNRPKEEIMKDIVDYKRETPEEFRGDIKPELIPDAIAAMDSHHKGIGFYGLDDERSISIVYGGALVGHWGIRIGNSSDYKVEVDDEFGRYAVYKWRDGMYSFFDEN